MTLEEKIKFIKKCEDENNLFISPNIIQGGAILVDSFETLKLYNNMSINTDKFIEELLQKFKYRSDSQVIDFSLVFCGDFEDLPNKRVDFIDFIKDNRDRIIIVYKFIKSVEKRDIFCGFNQFELVKNYDYIYLNFSQMLDGFEKNDIEFNIDYNDCNDSFTRFIICYNPKKEIDNGYQFKKVRKEG